MFKKVVYVLCGVLMLSSISFSKMISVITKKGSNDIEDVVMINSYQIDTVKIKDCPDDYEKPLIIEIRMNSGKTITAYFDRNTFLSMTNLRGIINYFND